VVDDIVGGGLEGRRGPWWRRREGMRWAEVRDSSRTMEVVNAVRVLMIE
jgi:hypothetical protein